MRDILSFSVPGSDSIHELQLGLTLIRFVEFDLAYFGEQCSGAYRKCPPDEFMDKLPHLREFLHGCHPWCRALIGTSFENAGLDCVIDDICTRENVTLEELWLRNMTAADRLGRAVFRRVTEYKTGQAINQWTNLQRMQAYALSKMMFIYGGEEADAPVHKARKLYYDLAFSLTAEAMGFSSADMPVSQWSGIPFLPRSGTVLKTAVNVIGPAVRTLVKNAGARTPLRGDQCVKDQMAGMVINVMTGLLPPDGNELELLDRRYGALPAAVCVPDGFKAIIDLEYDQLFERGFYIQLDGENRKRMRYQGRKERVPEKQQLPDESPVSVPAGGTGAEEKPPKKPEAVRADKRVSNEKKAQTEKAYRRGTDHTAGEEPGETPGEAGKPTGELEDAEPDGESSHSGKIRRIIRMSREPGRAVSKERTLQEVNMRCNLIWTSMNVRSGLSITVEEASEWFRHLTRLRYGIGTEELPLSDLDKFLDATLETFKLLPENT